MVFLVERNAKIESEMCWSILALIMRVCAVMMDAEIIR